MLGIYQNELTNEWWWQSSELEAPHGPFISREEAEAFSIMYFKE